jgi:hypothetical protein
VRSRSWRAQCLPGLDPATITAHDGHAAADVGDIETVVRTMNGSDRRSQTRDSYTAGLGGIESENLVGASVGDKQSSCPIEC